MRLQAYCKRWRTVEKFREPALTFANPDGLVSTQNRQVRRGYRGSVTATKVGRRSLQVVNTVPMEQYLRPVVAAEVSPSWPEESLRAQAIAARSYAAHEVLSRAGKPFHVYDVIRSQAYPGAVEYDRRWRPVRWREHDRTDAAIAATAGIHVTADGAPALTQFSSSNGGVTAASPLPYMRVSVDEWDARASRNPRLSWTDSISLADLARRYPSADRITAVEVLGREGAGSWGGRITAIRIVGESRSYTVTGDSAIRSVLGTNSSVLTFTEG
jgi:SpoIID/LytB domain protein